MRKKIIFIGLITLILSSCNMDLGENKNENENNNPGVIINANLKIVIVDKLLQDRLDPDSKSYFGEKYAKEIEILYLSNNQKLTLSEIWSTLTNENVSFPEGYEGIQAPFRKTDNYGPINQNSLGYYFMNANPIPILAKDDVTHTYIRYPNGEEDEIKVQLFKNKKENITCIRKIWINGELVYSISENRILLIDEMLPNSVDATDPEMFLNYYNPKNYPFLEQILDDNGNPVGSQVQPKDGSDVVVIIKELG